MFKRTTQAAFTLGLAAALAPTAGAQEGKSAIALSGGIDWTTQYIFRGIPQEDNGIIIQPYGKVTVDVGDYVEGLSFYGGIWNSFHDQSTGATGGSRNHYELDLFTGATMAIPGVEGLSAWLQYQALTSPNGAFGTTHEIEIGASYAMPIGGINVNPYGKAIFEIQGGSDGGGPGKDEGNYYELGINPTVGLLEGEEVSITLSAPIAVAFGDNYYEVVAGQATGTGGTFAANDDESFGFFSAGLRAGMPLSFVPDQFGKWELAASVTVIVLNKTMEAVNGGDVQFIGTVGLSFAQ